MLVMYARNPMPLDYCMCVRVVLLMFTNAKESNAINQTVCGRRWPLSWTLDLPLMSNIHQFRVLDATATVVIYYNNLRDITVAM